MNTRACKPTNLRYLLFALAALIAAALPLQGAFLRNVPQTVMQPDGTVLHLFATGDEYYNRLHDAEGFTIVRDPASGFLVYAAKVDGRLEPTAWVVGRSDPATAGLEKDLIPDRRFLPDPGTLFPEPMMAQALSTPGVPTFSSINNIVVFIRFADETEFNTPVSTYDGNFNSGVSSLRSYFREASYQQLTVSSTFYPAASGGYVVSFQDSHPRAYYKPYDATTNPTGYDKDSTTDRAQREHTLLANAINAVASQIPGSLNVDTNGDGYVDNVCFIVDGLAVQGDWSNLLWPHQWFMTAQVAVNSYINGKLVNRYNLQLDDNLSVGVLCHEMTHTLGAPDLYHYGEASQSLAPVWKWDLMEYDSDPPEHMGAYMKYKYLGWIASIPQITTSGTYSLQPLTSATNNCYKIASANSSTEYFVLEYRRKSGTFESSVPGSGLLVYRINTSVNDGSGNANGPPDEVYIYRPGGSPTANGTPDNANLGIDVSRPSIDDSTDPSSFLSDGSAGGLSISDIGSAGSTISFTVNIGGGGSGGTSTIFSDNFEGSFPGSWQRWRSGDSPDTVWGKSTCWNDGGSGSAWCAAGGSAPQPPCGYYVGNMNTWMIYGPFSLSDATDAWAEFDAWYGTEAYDQNTQEGDQFEWLISTNGTNFTGFYTSGNSNGWTHKVFNFRDVTSITAIGSNQVWFAFVFRSDPYVQGGGAYVDNVVIKKTVSASCTYSISPTSQSFASAGGTGTVSIAAASGCSWTAASNAGWISITSGASGAGNGTVGYAVQANTGAARSGTLTIAGGTFSVSQAGASCSYSISPASANVGAGGGSGSFAVSSVAGCAWSASSDSGWLHVTGSASGSGTGTVTFSVDANGSGPRTGHITVQGQVFTLSQAGGAVSLPFSHWIAAASHVDGAGNSHWRSDVAVLNRSSSAATVEYRLYTSGGVLSQQTVLAANAQDFHKDIAAWLGYTTGSGALEVRTSQDVFVMGRTYNQVDATHSYGQNYDGQDPDSSLLSVGQSAWLPLLAQNSNFRCNIAITNTGTTTANVTLALYDGQGTLLWSGNAESGAIASGGFIQYLTPFQKYAGRNDLEHAYAKVTVNSGSGVIAWASVVDNATGDPTTIFMRR
jgi:M6 family metalloprotease-like protein